EPLAATGQVVPRHPALHRAVLPGDRGVLRSRHRLVRDPVHRPVPAWSVPLRRGRHPLAEPGRRVRLRPRHRPVPAVPPERLTLPRPLPAPTGWAAAFPPGLECESGAVPPRLPTVAPCRVSGGLPGTIRRQSRTGVETRFPRSSSGARPAGRRPPHWWTV